MYKKNKGNQAEKLVCDYLNSRGYKIIFTNYYSQWGEVDIIAEKNNITHFVEVKCREVLDDNLAEYSFNYKKQKSLWFCINKYLMQTNIEYWQIDLVVVYNKSRRIILYYNIILDFDIS